MEIITSKIPRSSLSKSMDNLNSLDLSTSSNKSTSTFRRTSSCLVPPINTIDVVRKLKKQNEELARENSFLKEKYKQAQVQIAKYQMSNMFNSRNENFKFYDLWSKSIECIAESQNEIQRSLNSIRMTFDNMMSFFLMYNPDVRRNEERDYLEANHHGMNGHDQLNGLHQNGYGDDHLEQNNQASNEQERNNDQDMNDHQINGHQINGHQINGHSDLMNRMENEDERDDREDEEARDNMDEDVDNFYGLEPSNIRFLTSGLAKAKEKQDKLQMSQEWRSSIISSLGSEFNPLANTALASGSASASASASLRNELEEPSTPPSTPSTSPSPPTPPKRRGKKQIQNPNSKPPKRATKKTSSQVLAAIQDVPEKKKRTKSTASKPRVTRQSSKNKLSKSPDPENPENDSE